MTVKKSSLNLSVELQNHLDFISNTFYQRFGIRISNTQIIEKAVKELKEKMDNEN